MVNKRGKLLGATRKKAKAKKAVSPVVSTTLLIVIVIILAVIIFLWVRSFVGEVVEKEIAGVKKTADKFCQEVDFDTYTSGSQIYIINNGDVPIYKVDIAKKSGGTTVVDHEVIDLTAGATSEPIPLDVSAYDRVVVIPVLLGKAGNKKKEYTCSETVGVELV